MSETSNDPFLPAPLHDEAPAAGLVYRAILVYGPVSKADLITHTARSEPTVREHLHTLVEYGLVERRRDIEGHVNRRVYSVPSSADADA